MILYPLKFYSVQELQVNQAIEELQYSAVYLIRCVPTGQEYIGSTNRRFRQRWKEIRKHSRSKHKSVSKIFHQFWQEYGDAGFEFAILDITDKPKEREQYYISLLFFL